MTDIGKEVLGSINRLNETYRLAHGLGSSTRGNPVLVAGERRDANRSEADFRNVRCKQGETFEQGEARLFLEARDAFNEAIQEARRIVEQIGLPPFRKDQSAADYFDAVIADFVGDTWAVDPRAEC